MTEEPDFTIDYLDDLATPDQKAQLNKLEKLGWRPSHLWEKEKNVIAVWVISRRPDTRLKKGGYVHGYILADGTFHRFEATLKNLL